MGTNWEQGKKQKNPSPPAPLKKEKKTGPFMSFCLG